MQDAVTTTGEHGAALLALYDDALPRVYGYLLRRCGRVVLAEDLCAQTFLAAVRAVRTDDPPTLSVPWLIGVARYKLVDHWRAQAREQRGLTLVGSEADTDHPWDAHLETLRAQATLDQLSPHQRAALTLR